MKIFPEDWEEYKAQGKKALPTHAPVTYEIMESRIDVLSPTVVNHHLIYNSKTVLAEDMFFQNPVASTWTYVLDVKPESKEEFEQLSHEMLFDRISEADQQSEFNSTKTRMMHPSEANEDGTYTYLIMFDPICSGEYNFTTSNLYSKIYGEEKGKELDDQLAETLAGDQRSYTLIQSRKWKR